MTPNNILLYPYTSVSLIDHQSKLPPAVNVNEYRGLQLDNVQNERDIGTLNPKQDVFIKLFPHGSWINVEGEAERLLKPKDRDVYCKIASSWKDREAVLLKPQQHRCLSKTQIMTTQVNMPVGIEKVPWGPISR